MLTCSQGYAEGGKAPDERICSLAPLNTILNRPNLSPAFDGILGSRTRPSSSCFGKMSRISFSSTGKAGRIHHPPGSRSPDQRGQDSLDLPRFRQFLPRQQLHRWRARGKARLDFWLWGSLGDDVADQVHHVLNCLALGLFTPGHNGKHVKIRWIATCMTFRVALTAERHEVATNVRAAGTTTDDVSRIAACVASHPAPLATGLLPELREQLWIIDPHVSIL